MVGLVVVSHSRALARAAVELATEMLHGSEVPVEIAAGLDESTLGTDAVAISAAIGRADRGDGVVVLMDLGSAVLSAEMAVEMLGSPDVLLTPAPLVEGLVAAVVSAASGASREEVAAEASAALQGKQEHLGVSSPTVEPSAVAGPFESGTVTIANPHGLHARPAARLVTEARRFDAAVEIRNRSLGSAWVPAGSLSRVATLGVLRGHEIEVRASGAQARAAVDSLVALAAGQFGEAGSNPGGPLRLAAARVGAPPAAPSAASPTAPLAASPHGRGQAASAGVGIGPAWSGRSASPPVPPSISDISGMSVEEAVEATRQEISRLQLSSSPAAASIFAAHLLLLDDASLLDDVRNRIGRGVSSARAFWEAAEHVAGEFEALDDPYLKGRAADVRAVGSQVVRHLLGLGPARLDGDGVLVADDLTPADVAGLDPRRVTGVLLAGGSPTAHAAILARGRGIPMVASAGAGVLAIEAGVTVALDGSTGEFVAGPAESIVDEFRSRAARLAAHRSQAVAHAHEPAVTRDGVAIAVAANVSSVEDAVAAFAAGADLAGLVRTEFLFLDRDRAPSVDEQVATYRRLAEAMGGRRITLRTLDVGGDKPLRYAPGPPERNPFLGVRGLRHSLAHPALFRDQLEAIVRVARETPVSVMFPMVTSLEELLAARRVLHEADPPAGLEVGIMVEVPAAALKAGTFQRHVDFVSLGTNDLTQYTLAAERGNPAVPADGLDPAVLRLIDQVCRSVGVPVAVCGELASDEVAVPLLTALGVRELSVTPSAVPTVKEAVRAAGGESVAWMLELPDAAAVRRGLEGRPATGR
ncbi:phosphoenolpyruvate--protein phosphotransferase [Paractinoplanes globisporus]|uniref:Phosphocarrier protein HPr n=1 Tax=Paractinoplanes globisporus TaxID=113565 RepID=A0ABW6WBK1_9ACTN|nr:phosphoenolpyruvate--protein phosphotransferase [Actinoplanes globisporus]